MARVPILPTPLCYQLAGVSMEGIPRANPLRVVLAALEALVVLVFRLEPCQCPACAWACHVDCSTKAVPVTTYATMHGIAWACLSLRHVI